MSKRIIRIALDALSLIVLLGTIVFLIIYWKHIPEQVPTHFDTAGQIVSWGGKGTLLMEPVIMALLYVPLSFARTMRFRSLGKEVRMPVPELMFSGMKLPLLAGIAYMTVCTALARPLVVWCVPVFFGLAFLPMLVYGVVVLKKPR